MDQETMARIRENVNRARKGTNASRFGEKGVTSQAAKINSSGFQRLMSGRGLSGEQAKQVWDSFDRSAKSPAMARHAKAGERFYVTRGPKNVSGIFVSKKSLGKSAAKRIDKGALPPGNTAVKQDMVRLGKNQNVVYGKIKAQPGFRAKDPKNLPRRGGGTQTVTDGGFRSGAVQKAKARTRGQNR